jgi:hypothetical protein
MAVLARFFAARRKKSQQQIAARAAEVIERVLFDVGADHFVGGTLLLDKHFRLRFFGGTPLAGPDILVSIPVCELGQARALADAVGGADMPHGVPVDGVVHDLMRELNARCPQVRALP